MILSDLANSAMSSVFNTFKGLSRQVSYAGRFMARTEFSLRAHVLADGIDTLRRVFDNPGLEFNKLEQCTTMLVSFVNDIVDLLHNGVTVSTFGLTCHRSAQFCFRTVDLCMRKMQYLYMLSGTLGQSLISSIPDGITFRSLNWYNFFTTIPMLLASKLGVPLPLMSTIICIQTICVLFIVQIWGLSKDLGKVNKAIAARSKQKDGSTIAVLSCGVSGSVGDDAEIIPVFLPLATSSPRCSEASRSLRRLGSRSDEIPLYNSDDSHNLLGDDASTGAWEDESMSTLVDVFGNESFMHQKTHIEIFAPGEESTETAIAFEFPHKASKLIPTQPRPALTPCDSFSDGSADSRDGGTISRGRGRKVRVDTRIFENAYRRAVSGV